MLIGILSFFFVLICLLLILLVLVQKGSSSMGLGNFGGSNLLLFGGSGGQTLFQKVTWVLGALFMSLSLTLALLKTHNIRTSKYIGTKSVPVPTQRQP
jgi:protein translocase SecG subunit